MKRLVLIALPVLASLVSAAPAFAAIDINHNETFLREQD
jgi:hypothetical protein